MQDLHFSILNSSDWPETELVSYLPNAVLMSLFLDQRVDQLPKNEPSRRGYWADSLGVQSHLGSKLWTLSNQPLNDETLDTAIQYAYEALSWMLLDQEVTDIHVDGEIKRGTLILTIELTTVKGLFRYDFDLAKGHYEFL